MCMGRTVAMYCFDDHFHRPPALADVALEPPYEAQVRLGIHEDLDVHQIAQLTILENQNSFDDDRRPRLKPHRLLRPFDAA